MNPYYTREIVEFKLLKDLIYQCSEVKADIPGINQIQGDDDLEYKPPVRCVKLEMLRSYIDAVGLRAYYFKICKQYRDPKLVGELEASDDVILQSCINELILAAPSRVQDSLESDNVLLETVEDLVGSVQSKLGDLDQIQAEMKELREHLFCKLDKLPEREGKEVVSTKERRERKMAEIAKVYMHKKKKKIFD